MKLLIGTVVVVLVSIVVAAVWYFLRPLFVSMGVALPTADDYVVRGWKAQRRGEWSAALLAYCEALQIDPQHPDARERRDALLAALPELTDGETTESVLTAVQRRLTVRVALEEEAAALQADRDRRKAIEDDERAAFWLGDLLTGENDGPAEAVPGDPDRLSESPPTDDGTGQRDVTAAFEPTDRKPE